MSFLSDILNKARNTITQGAQAVGNEFHQLPSQVNNFQQQAISNIGNPVRSTIQSLPNTIMNTKFIPGQQNTFAQTGQDVANNFDKYNLYAQMAKGNLNVGSPEFNGLVQAGGQYVQGQMIHPLENVFNNQLSPFERITGGVQAGMNVLPFRAAAAAAPLFNTAVGGASGILKTIRQGGNLGENIRQSVTNPSDIAGTGLGITNPVAALPIDLLASRNPVKTLSNLKSLTNTVRNLKGYSPNAFSIHPDDQKIMSDFVNAVQTGKARGDLGQLGKDAQVLAEHYIGKSAQNISNEKLAKAFDALLSTAAKQRGEDALQMQYPKMGISTNDLSNTGAQIKGNKITLYHGTNNPNVNANNLQYGSFLSSVAKGKDINGNSGASEYGKFIHKIEVPISDVRLNSTGEFQYLGNSHLLQGEKYTPQIYKEYNNAIGSNLTAKEIDNQTDVYKVIESSIGKEKANKLFSINSSFSNNSSLSMGFAGKSQVNPNIKPMTPISEILRPKVTNDTAEIQRLKGSVDEGMNILKSGINSTGRKLTKEELQSVARSVANTQAKIGKQIIVRPGQFARQGYVMQELSSDQAFLANKNPAKTDLSKQGLRNWNILVKQGKAKYENGRFSMLTNDKASNRMDTSTPPQIQNEKLSKGLPQTPGIESNAPTIPSSVGGSGSSGKSIAQVPNSQDPYFNTNKYNISPEAKAKLNEVIQEVKPQIQAVVGKKLSNQEVINTANASAKVLNNVVDRSQTEDYTARLLRTRQQLAAAGESGKVDQSYIDNLLAVKSHATDIARKLQSFSIGADPKTVTSRDAILEAVLKVEKDTTKITEAAKGVDFNDLKQATDFYRKFVKPSTGEWVDLIRYNSMLSSPGTHIVNAASNLLSSAVIAPIEKTLTGTIDFLGSSMLGKKQTQFAGEGMQYAKGYASSLHDAAHAFADSLRGKIATGNLDIRQIPLDTSKRIANLNLPTRLLEASDQFFTKLTQGAETAALQYRKGKGVKVGNIETQALDNARYRLFRSELHTKRQGTILNSIDDFTSLIQRARNSSNPVTSTIAKFTLPFVQTPMNILKQGVEYSPIGFLTTIGAPNKTEQISKAILGSSAAAATAMLVASGRTTWAEPTDSTKKAAFRAAGMQPYAVKIGNNWVSYAKLPPQLGFSIAFISALHDAEQNKTIDQNQLNVILNASAKFGNFFADQSYVKNIGDVVSAAKGSPEAMARFVSNYPQQLIPYRALLGWMARITDPYQRKVNTDANFLTQQVQQLFTQIPGLSQTVPARLDKSGEPIPNQNAILNAFSPLRVTNERGVQKQNYDLLQQKSLNTKNENIIKDKLMKGEAITLPQAGAAEKSSIPQKIITTQQASAAEVTTNAGIDKLKADMQLKLTKDKVQTSGNSEVTSNGSIIYKNVKGGISTIDLTPPTKGNGINAFTNTNWKYSKAREIWDANITQAQKDQAFNKLGVNPQDVRYDSLANHSNDIKTQYVVNKNLDHATLLQRMITGRVVSVSGQQFASNGVIDNLTEQGLLSKNEGIYLKKIKLDKNNNQIGQGKISKGTGSKRIRALATFQKNQSSSLSKLFTSQIKNTQPNNVSNLTKVLQSKSPKSKGLSGIQNILSKSEALAKGNNKRTIQQVLGG